MATPPHIVLVHGLGRSKYDMFMLSRAMRQEFPNSAVHSFDYQSRSQPLAISAEKLAHFLNEKVGEEPVSFIGHSLGGIVVRALDAAGASRSSLQRLVTLGSPHNSAQIARYLSRYSAARKIFGPVLSELASLSLPTKPRQLEIGCIIGATGNRLGFFPLLGADNDGLVLAKEALLEGCTATLSLAAFHGLMPFSPRIARHAAHFLKHGAFFTGA